MAQQPAAKSEAAAGPGAQDGMANTLNRGVKLIGEVGVAPGASLLLDGDMIRGGAHLIGGLAARAVLGPIGLLLVAANSYSKSVTGCNLHEHFTPSRAS